MDAGQASRARRSLDEDGDLDTEYIDDEDAKTEKQLARERERADRQNNGADEFASGPPSFASDASHDAMGSPGPKSPSDHAARKWLRKTQSRRGASKSFSQPANLVRGTDATRSAPRVPIATRGADEAGTTRTLISFASRVVIELEMRPYKTIKTLHSKTFTGADFIEWSMTQPEGSRSVRRALHRQRAHVQRHLLARVLRRHGGAVLLP